MYTYVYVCTCMYMYILLMQPVSEPKVYVLLMSLEIRCYRNVFHPDFKVNNIDGLHIHPFS